MYHIPKSNFAVNGWFTYATLLDLEIECYTLRLGPDAQKVCTTILPWNKYSYLPLPMGIAESPKIFQHKIPILMETLEFIHIYLDDLLTITKNTL